MTQDAFNKALDELAEETARQIIWTLQPGATADPLKAVKELLYTFLDNALLQMGQKQAEENNNAH